MKAHPMVMMGREAVPLHVIDDAHPDPHRLRAAALAATFERMPDDFYPGLRAPAPDGYGAWLEALVGEICGNAPIRLMRTTFAMAIDDPATLAPIQRIPHFDTYDTQVIAAVHYLSTEVQGGTNFYCHRQSGYERIDHRRTSAWRQALVRDATIHGLPEERYAGGSDARFERIGHAEWRFNRLILYPANCLHAGDLGHSPLRTDIETGRMTLTSLLVTSGHSG